METVTCSHLCISQWEGTTPRGPTGGRVLDGVPDLGSGAEPQTGAGQSPAKIFWNLVAFARFVDCAWSISATNINCTRLENSHTIVNTSTQPSDTYNTQIRALPSCVPRRCRGLCIWQQLQQSSAVPQLICRDPGRARSAESEAAQ